MGRTASTIVSASVGVLCFAWMALLLAPTGWHHKTGGMFQFQIGLYGVQVSKGIVMKLASAVLSEDKVKAIEKLTDHQSSIRESRDTLCLAFTPSACDAWTRLLWSSISMLIIGAFGVLCLALGAGFQHYYWHHKAFQTPRMWARAMFLAGPCCFMLGVLQYTFLTYDFHPYPELGAALMGQTSSLSVCYAIACTFTVLAFVPLLISEVFCGKSHIEEYNEDLRVNEEEGFIKNAYGTLEANDPQYSAAPQYGATPQYGTAPQYGAAPQYGGAPQHGGPQYGATPYGDSQYAQSSGGPQFAAPAAPAGGMPPMPPPGTSMA